MNISHSVHLRLPATSANLGPAFDAAALAIALHLDIIASPAADFSVEAQGRDPHLCGVVEDNLILDVYRTVLERNRRDILPLALRVDNEIPIGKGLGSSAAARVAGVALANHFGELQWSRERVLLEAAELEGHPDNVAACWLGGFVVVRQGSHILSGINSHEPPPDAGAVTDGEELAPVLQTIKILPAVNWPLILAVPPTPLSTRDSRRVLPSEYSRADVVANVQSAMLLVNAISKGRSDLLQYALQDRLHQPYRAALCPLLPALLPMAGDEGVLAVALSGAGPSVLLIVDPAVEIRRVRQRIASQLARFKLIAELIDANIELNGGASELPD